MEQRAELIALCEAASVPQDSWSNRDSKGAQTQVGEALMLLRAGCSFRIETNDPKTNDETIWLRIESEGFNAFEMGRDSADGYLDDDLFYIPTAKRLAAMAGKDWY